MAEIPVVVDTNLWGDLNVLLNRLKRKNRKSFQEIWSQLRSGNDNFITENLDDSEQTTFRSVIKFMKRIVEMERRGNYVVHVPSFVYTEAGRSLSSKITSDNPDNEGYLQTFREILDSLPVRTVVDDTPLVEGVGYPTKSKTDIEKIMKEFLKNKNQATLNQLLEHLRDPSNEKKIHVQERTKMIQNRIRDVLHKNRKWDEPMLEASKVIGFEYETRTKILSSLGSVSRYPDVDQINFQSDPLDVITQRLTMVEEEFDFFDLQIYLYAKDINAPIITKNSQAYQEINDPHFLGYFDDLKIIHPLINFDTIEDLNNSGDLNEIIDRSIKKDFNEVDLPICRELDKRLDEPILEKEGGELIQKAESSYSPEKERMEIKMSLGNVLKVLRFENKKLKVSRQFFFEEYNNKQVKILQFVDETFFKNKLSSRDFVTDNLKEPIEKTRNLILKKTYLARYLDKNPAVKETLQQFQSGSGTYLDQFLTKYRGARGLEVYNLFLALAIESHFSESEIKEGLEGKKPQVPLSFHSCPSTKGSRKRETANCLLKWEQIDEFNEEKFQKRNPLKVKINSKKFLEYVKTMKDPQERMQLIDFVEQVLNSVEDHTSKISGPKVAEVAHLTNNRKVFDHFSKVYHVSSALNHGLFSKDLLVDLLKGDIEGAALNVGLLFGNYGFSRLAAVSLAKGVEFAKEGKLMLGNSLKYASPFIGRFLSPLIAFSLYNHIEALSGGDKDAAIAGIVKDSTFLMIEAEELGISLSEIAGVIQGVSAVSGPIGLLIGIVVMIGADLYLTVRKVQKLDEIIHLTTEERWQVGAGSFFTLGFKKFDVEYLADIKLANNKLAKQALEEMKRNPHIQRVVVPSAVWKDGGVQIAQNVTFVPSYETSNIKWHRVRPEDPEGGKIFCAPQGDWENPPSGVMARCENAIGVADLKVKAENYTLFNLTDGNDDVVGFKDSPNIFLIGRGKKNILGGDKNDVFILELCTTCNDVLEGTINAKGGSNMLVIEGRRRKNQTIFISYDEGVGERIKLQIRNPNTTEWSLPQNIRFYGIDSIIGTANEVDVIIPSCGIKHINGMGGKPGYKDNILIMQPLVGSCNHDKTIEVAPNTVVINEAEIGKFSYKINDVHSDVEIRLKRNSPNKSLVTENNRIQHRIFVNGSLSDVVKLEFHHEQYDLSGLDIKFHFKDKSEMVYTSHLETKGYVNNNGALDSIAIYLKDHVEFLYRNNNFHALLKSNEPILNIIKKYRPIANALDISLIIYSEKDNAMISIGSNQKDEVLYNDPSIKTYLIGNKGNNIYVITSGRDVLRGPHLPIIPDIEIYTSDVQNHINTLDLHFLSQQIKRDFGLELYMEHVIDSEKLVLNLYTFKIKPKIFNTRHKVTSITFRNLPAPPRWESWCTRLHILLNNAPVVLRCDSDIRTIYFNGQSVVMLKRINRFSNYFTPLPLVFSGYEIIVIRAEDVELHTEVIVERNLKEYRFLRLGNDLILTNGFDFNTPAYSPTTVLIKNFYGKPALFFTLKYTFSDKVVSLNSEKQNIEKAEKLEDWYDEYDKITNNILGDLPQRSKRDLGGPKDPSSRNERKQSQSAGVFGTVLRSLSDFGYKSLDYIHNYFKYKVTSTPKVVPDPSQYPKFDFLNEHRIENERIIGSKPNVASANDNKLAYTDVNSTLLLLDTLVRKLNDSKYKLPTDDHLLPPPEKLEKKMVELTTRLGLDPNDIAGSLEKQQQRILDNISEE